MPNITPATILYIEDEPDLRRELIEELQSLGYRAFGAKDGQEALEILDTLPSHSVDCIICDVMMPGRSGIEMIDLVRAHRACAPASGFILVTALAGRDDMLKGLLAGADHYLVKPVDLDVLAATIATRLAMAARLGQGTLGGETMSHENTARRDVHLSRRETEVLKLLGQGVKSAEMAAQLSLSQHTVNQYVKEVYRKFGINSRVEAAKTAIGLGLVDVS